MTGYLAALPDRAVLQISGDDATAFLQGLITNNIEHAVTDRALYATTLTPQGKFLHDFFILPHAGGYLMECSRAAQQALAAQLRKFKLRAKVQIDDTPLGVAAIWSCASVKSAETVLVFLDPRLTTLGSRAILLSEAALPALAAQGCTAAQSSDYDLHRLALGVPEGYRDLIPEKSFPLDYRFDLLHGIDFNKGCYIGQEVTARMKHRGTLRKQIYCVRGETSLPPQGTMITVNGVSIGEMRSSQGTIGLALVRRDAYEAADTTQAMAGETLVTLSLPAWANDVAS